MLISDMAGNAERKKVGNKYEEYKGKTGNKGNI